MVSLQAVTVFACSGEDSDLSLSDLATSPISKDAQILCSNNPDNLYNTVINLGERNKEIVEVSFGVDDLRDSPRGKNKEHESLDFVLVDGVKHVPSYLSQTVKRSLNCVYTDSVQHICNSNDTTSLSFNGNNDIRINSSVVFN